MPFGHCKACSVSTTMNRLAVTPHAPAMCVRTWAYNLIISLRDAPKQTWLVPQEPSETAYSRESKHRSASCFACGMSPSYPSCKTTTDPCEEGAPALDSSCWSNDSTPIATVMLFLHDHGYMHTYLVERLHVAIHQRMHIESMRRYAHSGLLAPSETTTKQNFSLKTIRNRRLF